MLVEREKKKRKNRSKRKRRSNLKGEEGQDVGY